jgi:hypothetical protein
MPDPKGELGQIGPHGDPNGDAAWLAAQALSGAGSVSGVSYDEMSDSPPTGGHKTPYEEMKHTGISG